MDEITDIAVLKIETRGLPVMPWGDSSKLKVAEWVLAIGNPFQLNQTVTLGIVSALGRSLGGGVRQLRGLHPDRRGDQSRQLGGALVNARGELIGINTAIFSETGGYQGIGFAVPSNLARHVMDDLLKYGEVQRGTMPGVVIATLTTRDRRRARRAEHARRAGQPDVARLRRVGRGAAPGRHHPVVQRPPGGRRLGVHAHAGRRQGRHRPRAWRSCARAAASK